MPQRTDDPDGQTNERYYNENFAQHTRGKPSRSQAGSQLAKNDGCEQPHDSKRAARFAQRVARNDCTWWHDDGTIEKAEPTSQRTAVVGLISPHLRHFI